MAPVSQAGAVAFRTDGGEPRVLLVRGRHRPDLWIFPKGHIEPGESASAAALRELREEAGVEGTLVAHVGALEFQWEGDLVHVDYYLVEHAGSVPGGEGRTPTWCTVEDALQTLSFDDTKDLLRTALPLIDERRQGIPADPSSQA